MTVEGPPESNTTVNVTAAGNVTVTVTYYDETPHPKADEPYSGHATGGGWVYPDDDSTLPGGKANFGFTARYKNDVSTGKLNFQYKDADIHLKSTSIDWLTISAVSAQSSRARARSKARRAYTFRVQADDNSEPGVDSDHFDIKDMERHRYRG